MAQIARQEASWVILATGTIDPKGMRFTVRSDPAIRLNDYQSALRRWRSATDLPIIFCENSGADLGPLQDGLGAAAGGIEWLGFTAPEFPERLGKGYGEAMILRYGLDHSQHIGAETRIVKITGRLFVKNFAAIEKGLRLDPVDIACDLDPATLQYSDCRLFAATSEFLRDHLLPEAESMDELVQPMVNFERVLARASLKAIADGKSWRALPYSPLYEGVSGTFGNSYRDRRYLVKAAARRLRRRTNHWW